MKRYTLKIQTLDDSVTRDDFKFALDELLWRVQPSLTYHLGAIEKTESGSILAEIASDANKDFLETQLKKLESRLAVRIEGLGWGWVAAAAQNQSADASQVTFLPDKKLDVVRYLLLFSLPLVAISLLIVRSLFRPPDGLEWILYFIYIIWLLSLNETPLDFRLYVKQINFLPDELVLTHWFRKETSRVKWESLWGFEMKGMICHIYSTSGSKVRFHIRSGFKNAEALFQGIARRASLNEVDSGPGKVLYKRVDAP